MATTVNLSDPITTWVTKTNTISSDLGTKSSLSTSTTSNLVAAINELKTQADKVDSADIITLINANSTNESEVTALLPKFGTDFIDSAAALILIDANAIDSGRLDPLIPKLGSDFVDSAEARKLISVTDAGGDGTAAYNNATGVITVTGPTHTQVAAHFVAGAGIAFDSDFQSSSRAQIKNSGVTSIIAGSGINVDTATGAVTVTNNGISSLAEGNGITVSGNQISIESSFLSNTSSAISSGSQTSFTASTFPTFISGRTNSSSGGDFTVTVGGSGHTLSMRDGDGGTFDTFATLLPAGASISGASFQFVAVQMRPA